MSIHWFFFAAALAMIPLVVFEGRRTLIRMEDAEIKRWLKKDMDYKEAHPFPGYSREQGERRELRVFLLGFLRAPDAWGRAAGMGGRSEWERRREEEVYAPWTRACSRMAWKPQGSWEKESAAERLLVAFVAGLCASVAVFAAVRGVYYLSLFTWPYAPHLMAAATVVLAAYWFRRWS